MRKLFLFLFAALMSVGMFATTVVTITKNDFPSWGKSFTKDGVTVSAAGFIDGSMGNIMDGGSFSTTLGNFTQIEVTAAEVYMLSGEGWSGDDEHKTWTGNASSVSFSGDIMGNGQGVTLKFTIEPATVAVTGVTLNQNEAQMTVGEELTLTATVNPGNATNKDVMWSSDNGYVATIENGVITAEGEGTATITVTTVDGEYTATCAVTVTAPEPEPQPTTVTWGATEFSSFGVDYLHDSRTVKGITVTVNAANQNFINVTEYGTTFNATIDNAFTFSTELGNITKIECTTLYAKGTLGDGWTIGANSATWEGNTNTLNFGNAGSMLVVSNIIFTIGGGSTPEPQNTNVNVEGGQDPQNTTYYYSTFFDSQVKYLLPEGVEAYVATISGDALTLTRIAVAGQTIPANNAVIFRATANEFTLTPSTADAVTFSATNSLQGTDIEINNVSDCYVLSDEDGVIGFYEYTGSLLNAHKAYITYTAPNNAPRRMRFIFAEEQNTTALDNAETDNMSVKAIENGQLVIIRNGVRYNAAGQVIE